MSMLGLIGVILLAIVTIAITIFVIGLSVALTIKTVEWLGLL